VQNRQLEPLQNSAQHSQRLKGELNAARRDLRDAEAELTREQATINAFRMQSRLKLGDWLDQFFDLRAEKQTLLTQLQMQRQAADYGIAYNDEAPFWQDSDFEEPEPSGELDVELIEAIGGSRRDRAAEKRLYRDLARRFHPDLAASAAERAYATSIMAAVNNAYAAQDIGTLRDLAGELDPTTVAALDAGDSAEIRQLRSAILNTKRRQRRVNQQLSALRRERTAQLWRRAQQMEAEGLAWWHEVRDQLQIENERYSAEITLLENQLARFDNTR
jgi:hypothetical protein